MNSWEGAPKCDLTQCKDCAVWSCISWVVCCVVLYIVGSVQCGLVHCGSVQCGLLHCGKFAVGSCTLWECVV